MSSPQTFAEVKKKTARLTVDRKKAVASYLIDMGSGFVAKVAARAGVTSTSVSRVLQGGGVSANIEAAILEEEQLARQGQEQAPHA